jgi:hypothetical protein
VSQGTLKHRERTFLQASVQGFEDNYSIARYAGGGASDSTSILTSIRGTVGDKFLP